jgi:cytochrome c oxidase accessory protein FixG
MYPFAGPAEVKGFYQKIRDLLQPILILVFLSLPWVQIHGLPAVLLDVSNRHFVFFGSTFYTHETPLLFFLIILAVLSIFVVTAIYGRLWCGWACPQTVFLHSVFNRVERWILGLYSQRMLFYKSEPSLKKSSKIIFLNLVFLSLCWIISHSFAAYFVGATTITQFVIEGPSAHMTLFLVCLILTFIFYFNFTFFRESLCMYVCPYGRFQNALIDNNSLVVSYDGLRGEPRGKLNLHSNEKGDCVDCRRCVNVCPAKIDIRDGFQLDCISCGQCIDACNSVMQKLNRPSHLIRYETGNQKPITLMRFRLALYVALIVLFTAGLAWSLYQRSDIDLGISRTHATPFGFRQESGIKILQNQIQLHLQNESSRPIEIKLGLSESNQKAGYQFISPVRQIILEPRQDLKTNAFIEIKANDYKPENGRVDLILKTEKYEARRSIQFIRQD